MELKIKLKGREYADIRKESDDVRRAFLVILAFLVGREVIEKEPSNEVFYDEMGEPVKRQEVFGNEGYGLRMVASPIDSGIGVHGEVGKWEFIGLRDGVEVFGETRIDMRGGDNFVIVRSEQIDSAVEMEIENLLRQYFTF